jgi:hypothetical protein
VRKFVDKMTEHHSLQHGLSQQNERLRAAIEAEEGNRRARERMADSLREEIKALETSP